MTAHWPEFHITCRDFSGVVLLERNVIAPTEIHAIRWIRMAWPDCTAPGVTCESKRVSKW